MTTAKTRCEWLVLLVVLTLAVGCGYVPTAQHPLDQAASGVRSPALSPNPSTPAVNCPNAAPSARDEVGATYDPIHKVTVVFGGDLSPTPSTPTMSTSETWTFDGRCWQKLRPTQSPAARQALGALVFDPAIGKTLLVGGRAAGRYPADAWLWDGNSWTQLTGSPRFGNVSAVYDAARRVVVVYGELSASGNPLESVDHFTWTWDGNNWLKVLPAHMPPPRSDAQMCYDDASQTTVLFGGHSVRSLGDTWEWNGTDWIQDQPPSSPPARFSASLICGNGRVILAGGADVAMPPFADVWTWDGHNWSQLKSLHTPTGLLGAAGTFDGTHYLEVLGTPAMGPALGAVWSFDGTDWTVVAST
jgi:hypothetical protein